MKNQLYNVLIRNDHSIMTCNNIAHYNDDFLFNSTQTRTVLWCRAYMVQMPLINFNTIKMWWNLNDKIGRFSKMKCEEEIGLKMLKIHPIEMTFGISTIGINVEKKKPPILLYAYVFGWILKKAV